MRRARKLTCESRGYPITKSSNSIPVIGHPRDRAPITCQIDARRTNHDPDFCYRYDYNYGFFSFFRRSVIGPRALRENNALILANQSARYIGNKRTSYNKIMSNQQSGNKSLSKGQISMKFLRQSQNGGFMLFEIDLT